MKYIILEENNPEEAVKIYSLLLLKISRPISEINDVTKYLFGWITHPTTVNVALCVDLDYTIIVHPSQNVEQLVQMLLSKSEESELNALVDYINENGSVKFGDLIPSTMHIYDYEQLDTDGWFPESEI